MALWVHTASSFLFKRWFKKSTYGYGTETNLFEHLFHSLWISMCKLKGTNLNKLEFDREFRYNGIIPVRPILFRPPESRELLNIN